MMKYPPSFLKCGRRRFDQQTWRVRRGSVPDAVATFARGEAPLRDHLLELKFIRHCITRYPVLVGGGRRGGGVARRANLIAAEYVAT